MGGWHIAATVCGFLSLVLLITALASDYWVVASDGNFGLWKVCISSSLVIGCNQFGMDVKGFMHATRAFIIMAVFPGFVTCALLVVLFSRTEIGSYSVIRIIKISSCVAGAFTLISMIIFTAVYKSSVLYGWSAVLGWIAASLFLLTNFLSFKANV